MKNQTINEAIGVTNERATMLVSILFACMFIAVKRQEESGEVEANDGYNVCEGVEASLKFADSKEEAYVIGDAMSELDRKLSFVGIDSFKEAASKHYKDTDTVQEFADKLYAANNDTENSTKQKHFAAGISNFPFN